jgi:ribonuclease-3
MTVIQNSGKNYQRLEFLGDRVLNLIVSHYLYKKFPDYSEGQLTNKLRFTSNDNLEEIIGNFPGEFKTELFRFKCGFKPDAQELNADDLEAFIGNYFLEQGIEESKNYFEELLKKEIDAFDPNKDYISMLQIHIQKNLKIVPEYRFVNHEPIQNNQQMFYFEVFVREDSLGKGSGTNKSQAKKQAALEACKRFDLTN